MATMLKRVPGIEELLHAQVRDSSLADVEMRTWVNLMNIYPYLPVPDHADVVVDLGCGSGRMTIALTKHWSPFPCYFLVDGDVEPEEKIGRHQWGTFKDKKSKGFYTRKDVVMDFVHTNNVSRTGSTFITIDKHNQWDVYPEAVDLMISMYAVGTHYPLSMYSDVYPRILSPGATFIFTKNPQSCGPIPKCLEVIDEIPDMWRMHAKDPKSRSSKNTIVITKYKG